MTSFVKGPATLYLQTPKGTFEVIGKSVDLQIDSDDFGMDITAFGNKTFTPVRKTLTVTIPDFKGTYRSKETSKSLRERAAKLLEEADLLDSQAILRPG